jgi:outer membrane lipoprotein-sorting protein
MKHRLLITALLLLPVPAVGAQDHTGTVPTADEIVSRMAASDLHRQSSIEGYAGMRRYVLENEKLKKRAEMTVRVKCDRDGTKHFEVLSEDGWKAAHKHVLHKMLESESDASRPGMRATARLVTANYDFALVGTEQVAGRTAYVLELSPKRREKYLFKGRIWVDAEDFALVRAEGSPAKNPSFWTKSTHFVQLYQKNGAQWFPVSTQSVTDARIFGSTEVDIEYFDYAAQARVSSEVTLLSTAESSNP